MEHRTLPAILLIFPVAMPQFGPIWTSPPSCPFNSIVVKYQQPLRHTHQHPFFPHTSGSFSQAQDSPSSLIMAWPPIHSAAFSGRVKLHPKFGVTAYPRCFSFNSNEPNKFIIEQLYNPLSHSLVTVDLSSSESAIETQTSSELGIVSELRCTNHDVFLKSSFSLSFWDFFFFLHFFSCYSVHSEKTSLISHSPLLLD